MSILVSQVHMMAGENKCKEKVPDVSDPNQNVETTNSSLHNLKIYSSKGCRKTSQRWIYDVHNVAKLATYLGT